MDEQYLQSILRNVQTLLEPYLWYNVTHKPKEFIEALMALADSGETIEFNEGFKAFRYCGQNKWMCSTSYNKNQTWITGITVEQTTGSGWNTTTYVTKDSTGKIIGIE